MGVGAEGLLAPSEGLSESGLRDSEPSVPQVAESGSPNILADRHLVGSHGKTVTGSVYRTTPEAQNT